MKVAAVDLFCGIGGLTYGVKSAGIQVIAGIDNDATCQFGYEKNNHSMFICKNIEEVTSEEISELYPKGYTKVLMGCAPCQPFSMYSRRYKKIGKEYKKRNLLYYFSNLVKKVKPEIVSMENVPQIIKEEVFTDFIKLLKKNNYHTKWEIVFCPDYGVPQNRKRLVLLASQKGPINLIKPLYSKDNYLSVRDFIGHLPQIEDGETSKQDPLHKSSALSAVNKERIRQSIPGGSWKDWDSTLQLSCHKNGNGKKYSSVYGRMEWDKPSPTITTQFYGYGNGRFGHPEQNRAISLREGALLQTFPANYNFFPEGQKINIKNIGMHIGNAVPVQLGKVIGLSIKIHLSKHD